MSDSSTHTRRHFVVETVEDQPDVFAQPHVPAHTYVPEEKVLPPYQPKRTWQPGELKKNFHEKVASPQAPFVSRTTPSATLPAFLQDAPSTKSHTVPTDSHSDSDITFTSLATVVKDRLTNMQSIAMSIPAFVTVALFMSVLSFFAGRFSAGRGKQVAAQENPLPTIQPIATPVPEALGTPDDIIKSARDEFAKAVTLSKKTDVSASEKEQVSKTILHVLDSLTKGITAYPDVASLYFERAQVEKLVMESAPTLKAQAELDYQKALELSPLSAAYYVGYADYYDGLSQSAKAIENYEKAARLDPKSLDALYPLAKLYKAAGRMTEASTLYSQMLSLLPSSSSQYAQVQQEAQALSEASMPIASSSATPVASSSATPQ